MTGMFRTKTPSPVDSVWIKASVLGGLWASVEIIVGSFFHNLRLPMAGTILASIATVMMISFYQLWHVRGLIWRAGLIAALMKSVSPSAVILGPMIGIMTEALIIEIFIRVAGNNPVTLSVAGALSVSSALIHKIASLLILYGFNIVTISLDIFHFLAKQIKINNVEPVDIVIIVGTIYIVLGTVAALTGYYIGIRAKKIKFVSQGFGTEHHAKQDFFSINPHQRFSVYLLILHFLLIPSGLILLNFLAPEIFVPFVIAYTVMAASLYKRSLRRLLKPVFWIQLIIILLIASVNWKDFAAGGTIITLSGFRIGFEMVVRAIFVVVAFSSFSVELRNPVIRDALFRRGFERIYLSLGLSFSALPVMIHHLPVAKQFLRHPITSFSTMMIHADEWLKVFEELQNSGYPIPGSDITREI